MKKNTFYAIAFCMTLATYAGIEGTGDNSAELSAKEQTSVKTLYEENERPHTDSEIIEEFKKYNPNATQEEIDEISTPKQRH